MRVYRSTANGCSSVRAAAIAAGVILLGAASPASAHPVDSHVTPGTVWQTWTFEPGVVLMLVGLAAVYAIGASRLRRAPGGAAVLGVREIAAFAAGWLATAAALVSPIDAAGSALFSAHMVQHELLMIVAAPLLAAEAARGPRVDRSGDAPTASQHSAAGRFPRHCRAQRGDGRLGAPCGRDHHLARAGVVRRGGPQRRRARPPARELLRNGVDLLVGAAARTRRAHRVRNLGISVFTTAVYTSAIGALLSVAPSVWYSAYAESPRAWGLSPLEDQQLGGLIMWVPASIVYTIVGLWLFAAWLRESERRSGRVVAGGGAPAVYFADVDRRARSPRCLDGSMRRGQGQDRSSNDRRRS